MKSISIIIPHHQETIEQMIPLLSSINGQVGINFENVEVIVINDNESGALKVEDFKDFARVQPRVKILFNPKEGYMGVSRQIGIDAAQGEYLLFCDSDDAIYSNTVLMDLFTRGGADCYSYKFIEQSENGMWMEHNPQFTWMFANCYRRQFLVEHDVRFHDNLLWHEDTYFNQVFLAYGPRVEFLGYVGYDWIFSPNTITRRNNAEYTSKSLCMFIDALDARLERVKYVIPKENYQNLILEDIVYMYTCLQSQVQPEVLDQVRGDIEKRTQAYLKKYDPELTCLRKENAVRIHQRIATTLGNSIFVPTEGLEEFVRRVFAL